MKSFKVKTLFDGEKLLRDVIIVCKDEKIVFVGNQSDNPHDIDFEIDLGDSFVMPSLIDCHVHIIPFSKGISPIDYSESTCIGLKNLSKLRDAGVAACRDLGAYNALSLGIKRVQENNQLFQNLPKLIACGNSLSSTGGHGHEISIECDGADSFIKGTRKVIKDGADLVKIMVSGGGNSPGEEPGPCELNRDEVRCVVEQAHMRGKKVSVHTHGATAIRMCVEEGVDSIEHGVFMDDFTIDLMKNKGTYYVPTLSAPYYASIEGLKCNPDNPDHKKSREIMERHNGVLRKCFEKGVNIAMGTDAGCPFNPFEKSYYELILMNKAGIGSMDVLKIATSRSAKLLDLCDLGYIREGMQASFIVLKSSPLEDMENLDKERSIYFKGKLVFQKGVKNGDF